MQFITISCGLLLTAVGLIGYFGPAPTAPPTAAEVATPDPAAPPAGVPETKKSITALIPAFLGVPLALLGVLALNERFRKHAMHLAAVIGLLGLIGGASRGLPNVGRLLAGELDPVKRNATLSQLVLALISATFVALCVNSFIEARRARSRAAASGTPAGA